MKVFITGASSGIGTALARAYAAKGAQLGLVARRKDALEALATSLSRDAVHPFTAALDVTDHAALSAAAADFMRDVGTPDIVIANAGISSGTHIGEEGDLDVIGEIFATNVVGLAATFAPFIKPMQLLPQARLVSIASVAGIRGLPGSGAYCGSKAAVTVLTESLRTELQATSIKVVTIAPGFIDTPMTQGNPYRMPFLMPVDRFAAQALEAIERGVNYRVIPWQMGVVAKLLRLVPNALYDRAVRNARRKPRRAP